MDYKRLLDLLIMFLIFFGMVYLSYYTFILRPYARARKKLREKKMPADLSLIKNYYHVDIDKVGHISVLRLLNFVNSFLIALIMILIIGLKGYVIQMIVAALLVFPLIFGSYWLVSKILKKKERKNNNV